MIEKTKRVRLKGKPLAELNRKVYDREQGRCAICHTAVQEGTKAHHEPCAALKSDELEKMVLLCPACHFNRHFGAVTNTRAAIKRYIEQIKREG